MKAPVLAEADLILLGAGGHAKVLLDLLRSKHRTIAGICDPLLHAQGIATWNGYPVLGNDDSIKEYYPPTQIKLVNAVGQTPHSHIRQQLYESLSAQGYIFEVVIHPSAILAHDVMIGRGVQVMAGAIIQSSCSIGQNTIVNTKSSIDHDCQVGEHVHIAPGSTICGGVRIGNGCFIGAGATIIQNIRVGDGAIVGAGSVLTRDLRAGALVTPLPAKER